MTEALGIQGVGEVADPDAALLAAAIAVAAATVIAADQPAFAILSHVHVLTHVGAVVATDPGIAEIMGKVAGRLDEIGTVMHQPPLHVHFIPIWNIQRRQYGYFTGDRIGRITPGIRGRTGFYFTVVTRSHDHPVIGQTTYLPLAHHAHNIIADTLRFFPIDRTIVGTTDLFPEREETQLVRIDGLGPMGLAHQQRRNGQRQTRYF
ncbi:hypothetical protein D3C79_790620 [compost metagenome]